MAAEDVEPGLGLLGGLEHGVEEHDIHAPGGSRPQERVRVLAADGHAAGAGTRLVRGHPLLQQRPQRGALLEAHDGARRTDEPRGDERVLSQAQRRVEDVLPFAELTDAAQRVVPLAGVDPQDAQVRHPGVEGELAFAVVEDQPLSSKDEERPGHLREQLLNRIPAPALEVRKTPRQGPFPRVTPHLRRGIGADGDRNRVHASRFDGAGTAALLHLLAR